MDKKSNLKSKHALQKTPCHICGETKYEWGRPGSTGGVYFLPQGTMFGFCSGEGLFARKCLSCGNMQLFIKELYEPF